MLMRIPVSACRAALKYMMVTLHVFKIQAGSGSDIKMLHMEANKLTKSALKTGTKTWYLQIKYCEIYNGITVPKNS